MTPSKTLSSVDPEILEIIQQLRLMDDYFMQVCLQNSVECTELILRIILDKPDLKVQRVTAQKALANLYGHDARLDVFALDSENQPYDIEIDDNITEGFGEPVARDVGRRGDRAAGVHLRPRKCKRRFEHHRASGGWRYDCAHGRHDQCL